MDLTYQNETTLPLEKLDQLWEDFGDIPVNVDDEIEEVFLHFPINTNRLDIWHWFEALNKDFSVAEKLIPNDITRKLRF